MLKPRAGSTALLLVLCLFSTFTFAADLKEWTVLVYLNGHNNLDSFGKANIDQMTQVGSSDQVNVVVQWASIANKNTKRLYVKKDGYDVIQDMPPVDMGSYKSLIEFIRWGQANYPAKKFMVDVWNHGNGWHLKDLSAVHAKDISFDDVFSSYMTTEQLGQALAEGSKIIGQKIELYASDACLMAMGEVAAEMSDSVKFFGGSQETEPGSGWPYANFLTKLTAQPAMDGGQVATMLSQEYKAAYSGGVYGTGEVTFSAWDLSKLDGFMAAIKNLATELKSRSPDAMKAAYAAIDPAQGFALMDYKDIGDYLAILQASNAPVSAATAAAVTDSMKQLLLSVDVTQSYSHANGISLWIPTDAGDWASYGARYTNMKFNQKTGWGDFVFEVLKQSPSANKHF
jgi:hypothetical protein